MCRIMIALAQISSIMIILVGSIGAIKSLILHASVGQFMIVRYVSELVAELIIMLVMMKVGKSLGEGTGYEIRGKEFKENLWYSSGTEGD